MKWDKKSVLIRRIDGTCCSTKTIIENMLKQIEDLAYEKTENPAVREYLTSVDNSVNIYLYNIHHASTDEESLQYLNLSLLDRELLEYVYDEYVCSEELHLIKNTIDTIKLSCQIIYDDNTLINLLSRLSEDLELNLLCVPHDIDKLSQYLNKLDEE